MGALKQWIQEFQDTEKLHKEHRGYSWKYTSKQKEDAVDHYLSHGQCYMRTIRKLGYPKRATLRKWVSEYSPAVMFVKIRYTIRNKREEVAVLALCSRSVSAKSIADDFGVTRQALYLWKEKLLGKERLNE